MTKGELIVYSLQGCGYSKHAESTLEDRKRVEIISVSQDEKDGIKSQNNMSTFPQIFLKYKGSLTKIGGDSDLTEIVDIIKKKNNLDSTVDQISKIVRADRKKILRLIEILTD